MGIVSLLLVRIDMIDSSTLSYYGSGSGSVSVGGFTWSGHFTWEGLPPKVGTLTMFGKFSFEGGSLEKADRSSKNCDDGRGALCR